MRTVAIVQARMGSSRLAGKVLMDLGGRPMLTRVMDRVTRASTLQNAVVATTTEAEDDRIANLCESQGWLCFRGDEKDVLDRYYKAAAANAADTIVRITSDCPLIDPELIDSMVRRFKTPGGLDYVSNTLRRSFPRGLDVEVFSFAALTRAWSNDTDPLLREHVTPYIYLNPTQFRIEGFVNAVDCSGHRWTVDTPEDLEFVRHICDGMGQSPWNWLEILNLVKSHPEWEGINQHIQQKAI